MRQAIQYEAQDASGGETEHENRATHECRGGQLLIECAPNPDHDHSEIQPHYCPHDMREVDRVDSDTEECIETACRSSTIYQCK